jgi:diguanylate cyclase (GGDEF)-like protein
LFLIDTKQQIVFANARLASFLGVGRATAVPELLTNLTPASQDALSGALSAALNDHADGRVEIEIEHLQNGGPRWCLASVTALPDDEGFPSAIVTLSDVTEIALLREELRQRATYDSLTGCLNRASTFLALQHVLTDAPPDTAAIIFIDLDGFKSVNDTLGHFAGDRLLAEVAHLITSHAGTDDVVAAVIGGDEFIVICNGLAQPADALAMACRLQRALTRTITVAVSHSFTCRPVSAVTMATPGTTLQALIDRADEAMYQSKRQPDRRPVFLTAPSARVITGRPSRLQ